MRVRLAEKFDREARRRVADDEQAGRRPRRARSARIQPNEREQKRALHSGLIQLRRMARRVVDMRKHHRPRQIRIGGAPPQFAVHKVGDAPQAEPGRGQRRAKIERAQNRNLRAPREPANPDNRPRQAAVKRHSALPQAKQRQRIVQQPIGAIKNHIPHPPADHGAGERREQQIDQRAFSRQAQSGEIAPPRPRLAQSPSATQPGQIREPIPMHGKSENRKGHRIDLGMRQHLSIGIQ